MLRSLPHGVLNGRVYLVSKAFCTGRPELEFSCGRLARFADGSVVVKLGNCAVMVTVVASKQQRRSDKSFLPLTVDFRQKASAAGRIPTTFLRRELGATEQEILAGRMIDRSVRPLFASHFTSETQIVSNLLASDGQYDSDVLSINGASCALSLSGIPWNGPVGACRVGLVDDQLVVNPGRDQLNRSRLNLVVAGLPNGNVTMIEGSANLVSLPTIRSAFSLAAQEIANICAQIQRLSSTWARTWTLSPKSDQRTPDQRTPDQRTPDQRTPDQLDADNSAQEALMRRLDELLEQPLQEIYLDETHDKTSRDEAIRRCHTGIITELLREQAETKQMPDTAETNRTTGDETDQPKKQPSSKEQLVLQEPAVRQLLSDLTKAKLRALNFKHGKRVDGRHFSELRPIDCQVGLYESLHGCALFQRGQTQVLSTLTFDSLDAAFKGDAVSAALLAKGGLKRKNFMLHYEFPSYATGEVGRPSIGRREIGHGALAERALRPIMPSDLPFTVRLLCEVLESNGSSSMASVCAGCLALMDAGVSIEVPVAGVAIGLLTRPHCTEKAGFHDYIILTDLMGMEDYFGDMDFKVAGTADSTFTAIQADIKLADGLPMNIVFEALDRAAEANRTILETMRQTIAEPRPTLKPSGPAVETLVFPPHKISRLLAHGGLYVKRMETELAVALTRMNETSYQLFAPNPEALRKAKQQIEELTKDSEEIQLEFGAIYTARIVEIRDNGVMVQLHPSVESVLLKNSQLDTKPVRHPSILDLKIGQEIQVKYFGRDPYSGAIRLSRKVLMMGPASIRRNFVGADSTVDSAAKKS